MLNPAVERVLYLVLASVLVLSVFGKPRYFLFLLGTTIPLMTPRIDVGIGLDWYKLVGPLAIGAALLNRRRGVTVRETRAHWALWFIVYATVVTGIWMYFEYGVLERYRMAAALEMGGGIAQNKLKMPVQLGSVLGQATAIFAVPLWARTVDDCRFAIRGVIAGTGASIAAGMISYALVGLATVNTQGMQGVLVYADYDVARLGGLSGEPKLLGVVLAVLFVYALALKVFGEGRRRLGWGLGILGLALFATFSTSAWAAVVLGIMVLSVWALLRPVGTRPTALFALAIIGVVTITSVGFVSNVIESRVVGRLFGDSGDLNQQKDLFVFEAFADAPANAIFGFGLGGGDLAVIPYVTWLHLKYRRTPTPGVTVVRFLGDLGTVGLVLLAWLSAMWARFLQRSGDRAGAVFAVAGLVTALLGSLIGFTVYVYVAGALLTAAAIRNREASGL